jgi:hypothetical protein
MYFLFDIPFLAEFLELLPYTSELIVCQQVLVRNFLENFHHPSFSIYKNSKFLYRPRPTLPISILNSSLNWRALTYIETDYITHV